MGAKGSTVAAAAALKGARPAAPGTTKEMGNPNQAPLDFSSTLRRKATFVSAEFTRDIRENPSDLSNILKTKERHAIIRQVQGHVGPTTSLNNYVKGLEKHTTAYRQMPRPDRPSCEPSLRNLELPTFEILRARMMLVGFDHLIYDVSDQSIALVHQALTNFIKDIIQASIDRVRTKKKIHSIAYGFNPPPNDEGTGTDNGATKPALTLEILQRALQLKPYLLGDNHLSKEKLLDRMQQDRGFYSDIPLHKQHEHGYTFPTSDETAVTESVSVPPSETTNMDGKEAPRVNSAQDSTVPGPVSSSNTTGGSDAAPTDAEKDSVEKEDKDTADMDIDKDPVSKERPGKDTAEDASAKADGADGKVTRSDGQQSTAPVSTAPVSTAPVSTARRILNQPGVNQSLNPVPKRPAPPLSAVFGVEDDNKPDGEVAPLENDAASTNTTPPTAKEDALDVQNDSGTGTGTRESRKRGAATMDGQSGDENDGDQVVTIKQRKM